MKNYIKDQIKPELRNEEQLLWTGRPRSGIILRPIDAFLIPFTLMWGSFAIFSEMMLIMMWISGGTPIFVTFLGIPFVLVGLYLIFGRFWFDAWQRTKIFYGVTDKRVIIIYDVINKSIKSLSIDTITDVSMTEKNDGSGKITFGPEQPGYKWSGSANWLSMGQYTTPSFDAIDNVRSVYEIILNARYDIRKM